MKYLCVFLLVCLSAATFSQNLGNKKSISRCFEQLPFVENKGQLTDFQGKQNREVLYYLHRNNFKMMLKRNSFAYNVYQTIRCGMSEADGKPMEQTEMYALNFQFVGCNPNPQIVADGKIPTYLNYYLSSTQGQTDVSIYKQITYKNIYPNIDVVFYGSESKLMGNKWATGLKYNFVVHAGGNVSDIRIRFDSQRNYTLTDNELTFHLPTFDVVETIPASFTVENFTGNLLFDEKNSEPAEVRYTLNDNYLCFETSDYSPSKTLVIDPSNFIFFHGRDIATYYGGTGVDYGNSITSDSLGKILIAGSSNSPRLTNGSVTLDSIIENIGGGDIFVAKFSPELDTLIWGTFYGGSLEDGATGIATDAARSVVVVGNTKSSDSISTVGAAQRIFGGGLYNDGFVLKLDETGHRLWATYIGGSRDDVINHVATDAIGTIYIVGTTFSANNIATVTSLHPTINGNGTTERSDVFMCAYNSLGTRIQSTYFGGIQNDEGESIVVTPAPLREIYIAGSTKTTTGIALNTPFTTHNGDFDAFVAKFNSSLSQQTMGLYFGGDDVDRCNAIDVDLSGNIYIAGTSASVTLPVTSGCHQSMLSGGTDGFIAKFNSTGTQIVWDTYFGGTEDDEINDMMVDKIGNILIAGVTSSTSQISVPHSYQITLGGTGGGGANSDAFYSKFKPFGRCIWSTYYGGLGNDAGHSVYSDPVGYPYLTGYTQSEGGITTDSTYQPVYQTGNDAFVVRFCDLISEGVGYKRFVWTNQTASFTSSAYGSNPSLFHYQWYKIEPPDTVELEGEIFQTFTIDSVTREDAGMYVCKVFSDCGYLFLVDTLVVKKLEAIPSSYCLGGSSTIKATSDGIYYKWTNMTSHNVVLEGAHDSILVVSPVVTTTYQLIYTTLSQSVEVSDTALVTITVHPLPTVYAIPPNVTLCLNDSTALNSFAIQGTEPYRYLWRRQNDTISKEPIVYIKPLLATNYVVKVFDKFGCTDTDTSKVTVKPIPQVFKVFGGGSYCQGGSGMIISISSSEVSAVYKLYRDSILLTPTAIDGTGNQINFGTHKLAGNYTVKASYNDPSACTRTMPDTVVIKVLPLPSALLTHSIKTCIFDSIQFSCHSDPVCDSLQSIVWNFGDGISSQSTCNPKVMYTHSGLFTATAMLTDTNGCSKMFTSNVNIHVLPTANFSFNTVCFGTPTTFTNLSQPSSQIMTSNWIFNNTDTVTNQIQSFDYLFGNEGNNSTKLVVSDLNQCVDSITKNVPMYSPPNATVTYNNTCFGLPTNFTATPNSDSSPISSYLWDFADGGTSTEQNPTHIFATSGDFAVSLTIGEGTNLCSRTIVTPVTIHPLPDANFSTKNLCFNDITQFTDSTTLGDFPLTGWLWKFNDNNATSNLQNPTHQFSTLQNFTVQLTVTDSNQCVDSVSRTVAIDSLPVASFVMSNDTLCANDSLFLSDYSQSHGTANYLWDWYLNSTLISSEQNPRLQISTPANYQVKLLVSNQAGCKDSLQMPMKVWALPNPRPSVLRNDCVNKAIIFRDGPGTFETRFWEFGDGQVDSIAHPQHHYATDSIYTYTLTVWDNHGCTKKSVPKSVEVYSIPEANFTFNHTCLEQVTQFTDSSVNQGGMLTNWWWSFDHSSDTITAQNPTQIFATSGTHHIYLKVMNEMDCLNDTAKTILVDSLPAPAFIADTVCFGFPTSLLDVSEAHGSANVLWQWQVEDTVTMSGASQQYVFNHSGLQPVTFTVTNENNCANSITDSILVNKPATPNFYYLNPCLDDTIQFIDSSQVGSSEIVSRLWDFGDGITSTETNPVHLYNTIGGHQVILTLFDAKGCSSTISKIVEMYPVANADFSYISACFNSTTQFTDLSDTTIVAWLWNFGDNNQTSNLQNPTFTYSSPDTFEVILQVWNVNGCTSMITRKLGIDSLPVANFVADTVCFQTYTHCNDASEWHGSPNINHTWIFDADTSANHSTSVNYKFSIPGAHTIKLIVQNQKNCFDTLVRPAWVDSLPTPDFSFNNVCQHFTTVFTDNSTLGGADLSQRVWNFGDGNTSNALNPTHYFLSAGNFNVSLSIVNTNGCSDTTSKTVQVYPLPSAAYNTTQLCAKLPTVFTDVSTPAADSLIHYQWVFPDGDINTTIPTISHTFNQPGSYLVGLIVENSNHCYDTLFQEVIIDSLPVANFRADTICFGSSTTFTDISQSHGSPNTMRIWNFGESIDTVNVALTNHIFESHGLHTVKLKVYNQRGCRDSITRQVMVDTLPQPDFTYTPACLNAQMQFFDVSSTGGAPIIYRKWTFAGSDTSLIQNPYLFCNFGDTFQVSLKLMNANLCRNEIVRDVYTYPMLQFNVVFDTIACLNTLVTFTNETVYDSLSTWNFGDGATSTEVSPSHTYTNTGFYDVQLISQTSHYCVDTLQTQIQIMQMASASFVDTFSTDCAPKMVIFTNLSAGDYISSFAWNFGNGDTSSLYNPPPIVYQQSNYSDTIYIATLEVSNQCGLAQYSDSILVRPMPVAEFGVTQPVWCSPDTVVYSNCAMGLPQSYLWNLGDGTIITDSVPRPHVYFTDTLETNYTVTFTVRNECGDSTSSRIVTVLPNTVHPLYMTDSLKGCVALPIRIIDYTAGNHLTIWWDMGDSTLYYNQDTVYHTYTEAGVYTVKETVTNGCSTSSIEQNIHVYDLPNVRFSLNDSAFCQNTTAFFHNTTPVPLANLVWNFGDNTYSTTNHPSHQYQAHGLYNVSLRGTETVHGCRSSDTVSVLVFKIPQVNFTVSDSFGCQPVTMQFSGTMPDAVSWEWNFNDGDVSFDNPTQHTFEDSGRFVVQLKVESFNSCFNSRFDTIRVFPKPTSYFTFSHDTITCELPPIDLQLRNLSNSNNSDPNLLSTWDYDGAIPDTAINTNVTLTEARPYHFVLYVENVYQCKDTSTLTYNIIARPNIVINKNAEAGCEPFLVNYTNSTPDIATHLWNFGDGSTSNVANPSHNFQSAGTYYITYKAVGVNTCVNQTKDTVTVYMLPQIQTVPEDFQYCIGDSVTVEVTGATSYTWYPDSFIRPIDDNNSKVVISAQSDMEYEVIGIDEHRCNTILHKPVKIDWETSVDLGNDTCLREGQIYTLDAGNEGAEYLWSNNLTTQKIDVSYQLKERLYSVKVTNGTCPTATDKVKITSCSEIDVPKAFSPNNDSQNDILYVRGNGVVSLTFVVISRSGQTVFESSSLQDGWDGSFKGSEMPIDVYYYFLKATMSNGTRVEKTGNISLLR